LDGVVTFHEPFDACVRNGSIVTCPLTGAHPITAEVAASGLVGPQFNVEAVPTAPIGASGTLKITVSADGIAPKSVTAKVTIAEVVDLSGASDPALTVHPGDAVSVRFKVKNTGSVTVHGVALRQTNFDTEAGIDLTTRPAEKASSCVFNGDLLVSCFFNQDLLPGRTYVVSLPYKVPADALAPVQTFIHVNWQPAQADYLHNPGDPGNGSAVQLVDVDSGVAAAETTGDHTPQIDILTSTPGGGSIPIELNSSTFSVEVAGDQKGDLTAIGDSARGSAHAVVDVEVGIGNTGPAAIGTHFSSGDKISFYLPPGTSAVSVPKYCDATVSSGTIFSCSLFSPVRAGESHLFPFKLRIDQVVPDATGKVIASSRNAIEDSNPSNDQAAVVINSTHVSPSASPSRSVGSMPITGAPVVTYAIAGLALLGAGTLLYLLARRRRLTSY
jgi:hypothetical protein